jgi:hypothetical protein
MYSQLNSNVNPGYWLEVKIGIAVFLEVLFAKTMVKNIFKPN